MPLAFIVACVEAGEKATVLAPLCILGQLLGKLTSGTLPLGFLAGSNFGLPAFLFLRLFLGQFSGPGLLTSRLVTGFLLSESFFLGG